MQSDEQNEQTRGSPLDAVSHRGSCLTPRLVIPSNPNICFHLLAFFYEPLIFLFLILILTHVFLFPTILSVLLTLILIIWLSLSQPLHQNADLLRSFNCFGSFEDCLSGATKRLFRVLTPRPGLNERKGDQPGPFDAWIRGCCCEGESNDDTKKRCCTKPLLVLVEIVLISSAVVLAGLHFLSIVPIAFLSDELLSLAPSNPNSTSEFTTVRSLFGFDYVGPESDIDDGTWWDFAGQIGFALGIVLFGTICLILSSIVNGVCWTCHCCCPTSPRADVDHDVASSSSSSTTTTTPISCFAKRPPASRRRMHVSSYYETTLQNWRHRANRRRRRNRRRSRIEHRASTLRVRSSNASETEDNESKTPESEIEGEESQNLAPMTPKQSLFGANRGLSRGSQKFKSVESQIKTIEMLYAGVGASSSEGTAGRSPLSPLSPSPSFSSLLESDSETEEEEEEWSEEEEEEEEEEGEEEEEEEEEEGEEEEGEEIDVDVELGKEGREEVVGLKTFRSLIRADLKEFMVSGKKAGKELLRVVIWPEILKKQLIWIYGMLIRNIFRLSLLIGASCSSSVVSLLYYTSLILYTLATSRMLPTRLCRPVLGFVRSATWCLTGFVIVWIEVSRFSAFPSDNAALNAVFRSSGWKNWRQVSAMERWVDVVFTANALFLFWVLCVTSTPSKKWKKESSGTTMEFLRICLIVMMTIMALTFPSGLHIFWIVVLGLFGVLPWNLLRFVSFPALVYAIGVNFASFIVGIVDVVGGWSYRTELQNVGLLVRDAHVDWFFFVTFGRVLLVLLLSFLNSYGRWCSCFYSTEEESLPHPEAVGPSGLRGDLPSEIELPEVEPRNQKPSASLHYAEDGDGESQEKNRFEGMAYFVRRFRAFVLFFLRLYLLLRKVVARYAFAVAILALYFTLASSADVVHLLYLVAFVVLSWSLWKRVAPYSDAPDGRENQRRHPRSVVLPIVLAIVVVVVATALLVGDCVCNLWFQAELESSGSIETIFSLFGIWKKDLDSYEFWIHASDVVIVFLAGILAWLSFPTVLKRLYDVDAVPWVDRVEHTTTDEERVEPIEAGDSNVDVDDAPIVDGGLEEVVTLTPTDDPVGELPISGTASSRSSFSLIKFVRKFFRQVHHLIHAGDGNVIILIGCLVAIIGTLVQETATLIGVGYILLILQCLVILTLFRRRFVLLHSLSWWIFVYYNVMVIFVVYCFQFSVLDGFLNLIEESALLPISLDWATVGLKKGTMWGQLVPQTIVLCFAAIRAVGRNDDKVEELNQSLSEVVMHSTSFRLYVKRPTRVVEETDSDDSIPPWVEWIRAVFMRWSITLSARLLAIATFVAVIVFRSPISVGFLLPLALLICFPLNAKQRESKLWDVVRTFTCSWLVGSGSVVALARYSSQFPVFQGSQLGCFPPVDVPDSSIPVLCQWLIWSGVLAHPSESVSGFFVALVVVIFALLDHYCYSLRQFVTNDSGALVPLCKVADWVDASVQLPGKHGKKSCWCLRFLGAKLARFFGFPYAVRLLVRFVNSFDSLMHEISLFSLLFLSLVLLRTVWGVALFALSGAIIFIGRPSGVSGSKRRAVLMWQGMLVFLFALLSVMIALSVDSSPDFDYSEHLVPSADSTDTWSLLVRWLAPRPSSSSVSTTGAIVWLFAICFFMSIYLDSLNKSEMWDNGVAKYPIDILREAWKEERRKEKMLLKQEEENVDDDGEDPTEIEDDQQKDEAEEGPNDSEDDAVNEEDLPRFRHLHHKHGAVLVSEDALQPYIDSGYLSKYNFVDRVGDVDEKRKRGIWDEVFFWTFQYSPAICLIVFFVDAVGEWSSSSRQNQQTLFRLLQFILVLFYLLSPTKLIWRTTRFWKWLGLFYFAKIMIIAVYQIVLILNIVSEGSLAYDWLTYVGLRSFKSSLTDSSEIWQILACFTVWYLQNLIYRQPSYVYFTNYHYRLDHFLSDDWRNATYVFRTRVLLESSAAARSIRMLSEFTQELKFEDDSHVSFLGTESNDEDRDDDSGAVFRARLDRMLKTSEESSLAAVRSEFDQIEELKGFLEQYDDEIRREKTAEKRTQECVDLLNNQIDSKNSKEDVGLAEKTMVFLKTGLAQFLYAIVVFLSFVRSTVLKPMVTFPVRRKDPDEDEESFFDLDSEAYKQNPLQALLQFTLGRLFLTLRWLYLIVQSQLDVVCFIMFSVLLLSSPSALSAAFTISASVLFFRKRERVDFYWILVRVGLVMAFSFMYGSLVVRQFFEESSSSSDYSSLQMIGWFSSSQLLVSLFLYLLTLLAVNFFLSLFRSEKHRIVSSRDWSAEIWGNFGESLEWSGEEIMHAVQQRRDADLDFGDDSSELGKDESDPDSDGGAEEASRLPIPEDGIEEEQLGDDIFEHDIDGCCAESFAVKFVANQFLGVKDYCVSTFVNSDRVVTRDYFFIEMGLEVVSILFFVLTYPYLSGVVTQNTFDQFSSNVLSGVFVVWLLTFLLFLGGQRVAYITRSMPLKVLVQCGSTILWHVAYLWSYDNLRHIDGSTVFLKIFALLRIILMWVGALQIQAGYPNAPHDTVYKYTDQVTGILVQAYRSLPFLYELVTLVDFIFTTTTLNLEEYFRIADIRYELYKRKVKVQKMSESLREKVTPSNLYNRCVSFAGMLLVGILLLVFAPLFYFSSANVIAFGYNAVKEAKLRIGVSELHGDLYVNHLFDNSQTASYVSFDDWTQGHALDDGFLNYDPALSIQRFSFPMYSEYFWLASQPARDDFATRLLDFGNVTEMSLDVIIDVVRQAPAESKEISFSQEWILTNEDRQILASMILGLSSSSSTGLSLPTFYNPFLLNYATGIKKNDAREFRHFDGTLGRGMSETYFPSCELRLSNTTATSGTWSLVCNRTHFDDSTIQVAGPFFDVQSTQVPTSDDAFLSYFNALGIIAFYTSVVLVIGTVIRRRYAELSFKVPIQEAQDPSHLLTLVGLLDIARYTGNFEGEGRLFKMIAKIFASPVAISEWAASKEEEEEETRQDSDVEEEGEEEVGVGRRQLPTIVIEVADDDSEDRD